MAAIVLNEPIVSDTIGYRKFRLFLLPLTILVVLICASRLYLGVHSSDQVFFGAALGFIFLVLFKYVIQEALYKFFWGMLIGK